jgi:hypothetical protein
MYLRRRNSLIQITTYFLSEMAWDHFIGNFWASGFLPFVILHTKILSDVSFRMTKERLSSYVPDVRGIFGWQKNVWLLIFPQDHRLSWNLVHGIWWLFRMILWFYFLDRISIFLIHSIFMFFAINSKWLKTRYVLLSSDVSPGLEKNYLIWSFVCNNPH